jgi:DNA-binding GntR family transcriptional regulator
LADRAYLAIRDRLIVLDIQPGEPIDDSRLAKSLGVGRTLVREALKRLASDRLVVSYPRRGTFATAMDFVEIAQISEIRLQLEPLAARRAAERAPRTTWTELDDLASRVEAVNNTHTDPTEVLRWDVSVHRAIYRAADNPHLEDLLVRYDNLATRIHCMFLDRLSELDMRVVAEHVALLRAIAAGDGDHAENLAREHVLGFERAVRAVM